MSLNTIKRTDFYEFFFHNGATITFQNRISQVPLETLKYFLEELVAKGFIYYLDDIFFPQKAIKILQKGAILNLL